METLRLRIQIVYIHMRVFNDRSKSGLFHVDFNHPDKIRTPKKSTELVKKITSTRRISPEYVHYAEELNQLEFDESS